MTTAHQYSMGWLRGPERPERWRYRLVPPTAPDVTKPRSLAKYATVLWDQGAEGSCTSNAGCLAAMMVAAISGQPVPVLSRMWKYYQERLEIGTFPQDSGADVVDEYDTDKSPGEIADSMWPYDAQPAERPPAAAGAAAKYKPIAGWQPIAASDFRDGILTALDNNQPVSIGLNVWNGWMTAWEQTGIWDQHDMTGGLAGGHAVVIIGWMPPNGQYPQGAYLFQNSWGATSPNNSQNHPDCTPGRGLLDAAAFALSQVGGEANAAVGQTQPAILSLAIAGPSTVQAGQTAAFSATLTGAPAGTIISYTWDYGDGSPIDGYQPTASHSYSAAGSYTVTCRAHVASTNASATATFAVSVTAAPTPTPTPTPQPTNCKATVDAVQATVTQALATVTKSDTRPGNTPIPLSSVYPYVNSWLTFDTQELDTAVTAPATDALALTEPVEPGPIGGEGV